MFGIRTEKKPNKNVYLVVAIVLILMFAITSAVFLMTPPGNTNQTTINSISCEASGGTWNECGSACLGKPQGTICPQVCVPQCEWFASSAAVVQSDQAYNSQPNFMCMNQGNGILMCWLPAR